MADDLDTKGQSTPQTPMKRSRLIAQAYNKIGALHGGADGGIPTVQQSTDAVETLNLILQEEDLAARDRVQRQLWARMERVVFLTAGVHRYTPLKATSSGTQTGDATNRPALADNIVQLDDVRYRNTSGEDTVLTLITPEDYAAIQDKVEAGTPSCALLFTKSRLVEQELFVYPVPASTGTISEVYGTDGDEYACIMPHTASSANKPITGADWRSYWTPLTPSFSANTGAWAADTEYTMGAALLYAYKRPLNEFTSASSDPDFPVGYTRYLIYRLALDLSPAFSVSLEERGWLQQQVVTAREFLFPSSRATTTSYHDHSMFY